MAFCVILQQNCNCDSRQHLSIAQASLALHSVCTRIRRELIAPSVAPASPGNHLAARLETPSDVHFLIKKEIWKLRTTTIPVSPASWVAS